MPLTKNDFYEAAFSDALYAIASGATRDETRNALIDGYSVLEASDISDVIAEALTEALLVGVEREDIDDSWF